MTAAKRRGHDGNVYLNMATPGIDGTPQTWASILSAEDVKCPEAWDTAEASDRGSLVKKYLATMVDWSIDFKITFDWLDQYHQYMQTKFRAREVVPIWIADGNSSEPGSSGPYADWLIKEFGKDMPLKDGMTINVKLMPAANCRFEPYYMAIGIVTGPPGIISPFPR